MHDLNLIGSFHIFDQHIWLGLAVTSQIANVPEVYTRAHSNLLARYNEKFYGNIQFP